MAQLQSSRVFQLFLIVTEQQTKKDSGISFLLIKKRKTFQIYLTFEEFKAVIL